MKLINRGFIIFLSIFILLAIVLALILSFNNRSDNVSSLKNTYVIISIVYILATNVFIYRNIYKYISDDRLVKSGLFNGFAAVGFIFSGSQELNVDVKKLKIECRIICLLEIIIFISIIVVDSI